MIATGVGSMPGDDLAGALAVSTDELRDLPYLPELPARGAQATLVGRGVALLADLGADLQPAGWRLTDAPGVDQRRARSQLAQDLDVLEEALQGYTGRLKIQVPGPWTLAATVERPRGDRVLADHGATREVAQSLVEGVTGHVADVRRRVPACALVVQVDEPALPAVLAGAVPTASGFGRHRHVDVPRADVPLRDLASTITAAGAMPAAHVCAAGVPVGLVAGAGFGALSFDLSLVEVQEHEAYATAFEAGTDLWLGVVPAVDPPTRPGDRDLVDRVERFVGALGLDPESCNARSAITPTCGLAGASPTWARHVLVTCRRLAALI